MALPHPTFPLPAPVSAVRPKKRKVAAAAKTATRATRQPSASTSAASLDAAPDGSVERAGAPRPSWNATFAEELPIPQSGVNSTTTTGAVEDRTEDDEPGSSASSCATRSESPPPIWIPPRTSTSLPDAPQSTSSTTTDARDARSSSPPSQPTPTPHPRLIIRIPSLAARRAAAQHKSPGPKSAPPVPPAQLQKRARSPTPDSEEDDFAASFMRKRRVSAALL